MSCNPDRQDPGNTWERRVELVLEAMEAHAIEQRRATRREKNIQSIPRVCCTRCRPLLHLQGGSLLRWRSSSTSRWKPHEDLEAIIDTPFCHNISHQSSKSSYIRDEYLRREVKVPIMNIRYHNISGQSSKSAYTLDKYLQ